MTKYGYMVNARANNEPTRKDLVVRLSKTSAAEFVKRWIYDVLRSNLSEEQRSYLRRS